MTTIYIADDGKQFEYEDECLAYEKEIRIKRFSNAIFIFDEEGKQLEFNKSNFEISYYILCKTKEAAAYMYNEFCDYDLPWGTLEEISAGLWYYDGDEWLPVDGILEKARIIKKIQSI